MKEVKHSVRQRITAENALSARYAASVVVDRPAEPVAPRATAVIRQQMFHFDSEHRESMLGPDRVSDSGTMMGGALSAGGTGSMYGGLGAYGSVVDDQGSIGASYSGGGGGSGRSWRGRGGGASGIDRRSGVNTIAQAGAQVTSSGGLATRPIVGTAATSGIVGVGGQQLQGGYVHARFPADKNARNTRRGFSSNRDYDYSI